MRRTVACVVATAVAVAVMASAASGAPLPLTPGYGPIGSFGSDGSGGTGPGTLTNPGHVAVDDATGNILVADSDGGRVEVFSPDAAPQLGNYLTEFGSADISHPTGIAIDQSNGDVYVAGGDAVQPKIARYVSDGAPVPTYTRDLGFASPAAGSGPGQVGGVGADFDVALAVDPSNHDLLVADRANHRVSRYNSSGGWVQPSIDGTGTPGGAFDTLLDVAVTSTSTYVLDSSGDLSFGGGSSRIVAFDSGGNYQRTLVQADDTPMRMAAGPTGDRLVTVHNDLTALGHVRVYVGGELAEVNDMYAGASQSPPVGVAIDGGASRRMYVVTVPYLGVFGAVGVNVLAEGPAVRPDDVVSSDARSAHLTGTIVPVGSATTARFEYSLDGTSWPPTADEPVGDGSGTPGNPATVNFAADVTGLRPHSTYRVRIVATDAQTTITSLTSSVRTADALPDVSTGSATAVTTSTATLGGTVNALGLQTTYYFEYGTTAAYGSRVPAASGGAAGNSYDARFVTRGVSGLAAGQTYHYRLVATSSVGTSYGADETFVTDGAAAGVARNYEMVSPPSGKNGIPVDITFLGVQARTDGNAVVYTPAKANYSDAKSTPYAPKILAGRSATGWTNTQLDPPELNANAEMFYTTLAVSDDLQRALVVSRDKLSDDAVAGNGNVYLHDISSDVYTLIATSADPQLFQELTQTTATRQFVGASADLSTVAFVTSVALTPGATDGVESMYSWSASTGLQLVSRLPDGTPAVTATGFVDKTLRHPHQVSDDGQRVFFQLLGQGLFVREGASRTVAISVSKRAGDPTTPVDATFVSATADGRYVVFTSYSPLTDDAPDDFLSKAYRYDVDTGSLRWLATDVQNSLAAWPESGDLVFISNSNLYYESGGTTSLAAAGVEQVPPAGLDRSDNGRYFVFQSAQPITSFPNSGFLEVYLYDTQTAQLSCPSCRDDGAAPTGDAQMGQGSESSFDRYQAMAVNDDGTVFFDTTDPLVPNDVNGTRDVYVYRSGRLTLISPGTRAYDATFADATPDGSNVFFVTSQRLVDQDVDDIADLYDARIGGGIAQQTQPPPRAACGGSECREPGPGPVSSPATPTQTSGGAPTGASSAPARARITMVRSSFTSKTVRITVSVSGRGRIRASGGTVIATKRSATKSGVYTLSVPLTRATQAARRAHRKVKVAVRVALTPPFGSVATTRLTRTLGK
ncbi:NHL repeat-containing protein [Conexibacter woesei]|uniref:NHL repeat-containing protein n=1 Tax=Conexibacter woesei TaxID=191495 RepID=UPI0012DD9CEF|nr:NHL repeat-containing protein [Conexibacter woesei]